MPAFANFLEDELDRLAEYTNAFANAGADSPPLRGNADAGKGIYAKSGCAGCHAIQSEGSVFGPDLSRIGVARSAGYIRESIVNPSTDIPQEWEGVVAVLKDGRKVQGLKVNEDTFTLQLRDQAGKFRMFDKRAELREVQAAPKSLMPAYAQLSGADLDNLLAYLDSLRANITATGPAKRAKGIH